MYKRLIKFIEKNKLLTHSQYGFRENRSTEHAVIELVDKVSMVKQSIKVNTL